MPTVAYHFYILYWAIWAIETRKQANYALKTESVKNRTACNDLNNNHTSATPKILKNHYIMGNLSTDVLQKESVFYHASVKNETYERKSFCFSARSNQLSP